MQKKLSSAEPIDIELEDEFIDLGLEDSPSNSKFEELYTPTPAPSLAIATQKNPPPKKKTDMKFLSGSC